MQQANGLGKSMHRSSGMSHDYGTILLTSYFFPLLSGEWFDACYNWLVISQVFSPKMQEKCYSTPKILNFVSTFLDACRGLIASTVTSLKW